jgi:hypothetical protein
MKVAVTFEFPNRPPVTHRMQMDGLLPSTVARRAIAQAQQVLRPTRWSSVVVLVDRSDDLDRQGTEQPANTTPGRAADANDAEAVAV